MNAESLRVSIALRVASLADIIRSKESAGREQDLAVLPILRSTTREKVKEPDSPSEALTRESERNLSEQIRRQLALPPSKRTNFLRVRLLGGGTAL